MFRSALGRGPIFQKGDRIELLGRVDIYAFAGGCKWSERGGGLPAWEVSMKLFKTQGQARG